MALAIALADYEDEVICDLAETYHIYNYRALPVPLLAVLVFGLPQGSRYQMALRNMTGASAVEILAHIADTLTGIAHVLVGAKKIPEESLWTNLIYEHEEKKQARGFTSGEEFMNEWRRLTHG